jgi:hypothetical protein
LKERIFSWATPITTTPSRGESGPIGRDERVFAFATFEVHERNVTIVRTLLDGRDQAVMSRLEQRRRGHRMAQVVVEEMAQTAGCLELGHVGVQVEAIDAPHFERDVVTDNVGDVGRHQNLLREIPVMVLLTEDTGHVIGPTSNGRAAAAPEGSPEREAAVASRCLPSAQRSRDLSRGLRRSFANHFEVWFAAGARNSPVTEAARTGGLTANTHHRGESGQ